MWIEIERCFFLTATDWWHYLNLNKVTTVEVRKCFLIIKGTVLIKWHCWCVLWHVKNPLLQVSKASERSNFRIVKWTHLDLRLLWGPLFLSPVHYKKIAWIIVWLSSIFNSRSKPKMVPIVRKFSNDIVSFFVAYCFWSCAVFRIRFLLYENSTH